jgi:threonyl-tRNA synthetase
MLVCGPREAASGSVSVRERKAGDQGAVPAGDFIDKLRRDIGVQTAVSG